MAKRFIEPEKFCFIFPIRPSFLAWGYSKMVISIVLLACFLEPTLQTISEYTRHFPVYIPQVVTYCVLPCLFIIDIVLQVMFIIGTYKVSENLWKVYHHYSKILLVLTPILTVFTLIVLKGYIRYARWYGDSQQMTLLLTATVIMFISLIIQTPIMITLKSELNRIKYSTFANEVTADALEVKIDKQINNKTNDFDKTKDIDREDNINRRAYEKNTERNRRNNGID